MLFSSLSKIRAAGNWHILAPLHMNVCALGQIEGYDRQWWRRNTRMIPMHIDNGDTSFHASAMMDRKRGQRIKGLTSTP